MWQFASRNRQDELIDLWQEVFGDSQEMIQFFLEQRMTDDNCVIWEENGRIVSAYYLLSASITAQNGSILPAQYLYAAGTRKASRGAGYMGTLLRALDEIGRYRNVSCTVLLPSEESLYGYYNRFGFSPAFFRREVTVSREEFAQFAEGFAPSTLSAPNDSTLAEIQRQFLSQIPGSLQWDAKAFAFAKEFQLRASGLVLGSEAHDGGYLFAWPQDEETEITEWIGSEKALRALSGQLLTQTEATSFSISLPANSPSFPGKGQTVPHGMLRPTAGAEIPTCKYAYLGLELA